MKKKNILVVVCMLILLVLSISVYAADEKEIAFNNKYTEQIKKAKTDDNGEDYSRIEKRLIKVSKAKKYDIYPETKYWFFKKYEAVRDTGNINFLMVKSGKMDLSKKEVQQLDPKKQEEVAIILKEAGGVGTGTIFTSSGIVVLLVGGILLFMYRKYGVYVRGAKKMDSFLRNAKSLEHEEELNRNNMAKIEKNKEELINENTEQAEKMEEDEAKIRKLDAKLRSITRFREGLKDKELREDKENIRKELSEFGIDKEEIDIILAMVKGKGTLEMHKLEITISKIRQENIKLHKLITKEIRLDEGIKEELMKGKIEMEKVKSIKLDRLKTFVERNEKMIRLKGKEKKFVDMIMKENDIESIIQKGGGETLHILEEFRQSIEELNKFNKNIRIQNSLLEAEGKAVKIRDYEEVKKSAKQIEGVFEEEKRFYKFISRKQKEQDIHALEALGKMKDRTMLGYVTGSLTESALKIGEIEKGIDEEYHMLEKMKMAMREKKVNDAIIADIRKFQMKRAANQNKAGIEKERMMSLEQIMHTTYENISGLSAIKDNEELERERDKIRGEMEGMKKEAVKLKRELNPLERNEEKTEDLGEDIINAVKRILEEEEKEEEDKGAIMRIRRKLGLS